MDLLDFSKSPILNTLKKLIPIQKRNYAGAEYNRFTQDWRSPHSSANLEIYNSLHKLRDRSRELARNNPHADAIFDTLVNDCIGTGMNLQSQVKMQRGSNKLNDRLNEQIEEAWEHWGKNCDVSGRLTFSELERLWFRTIVISGECLIRLIKQPFNQSEVPLGLELIMPDQLDDTLAFKYATSNGNRIFMGVEVDQWNRPVAYWIKPFHSADAYRNFNTTASSERIPAEEIIHGFLTEEPGQIRGVPWIYSSMIKLRDLESYEDALIKKARIESNIAIYMRRTGLEDMQVPASQQESLYNGRPDVSIPSGVIHTLLPGEEPVFNPSPAPNNSAVDFIRSMIKIAATGVGVTYSKISSDYSQNNYSQSRMEQLATLPRLLVNQMFHRNSFCNKIFPIWQELAVLASVLNIPKYFQDSAFYCKPRWKPPGLRLQDPEKEAQAFQMLYEMRVMTKTEITQQITGRDYEEVAQEISNEIYVIDQKYGLNIDPTLPNEKKMLLFNEFALSRAEQGDRGTEYIEGIKEQIDYWKFKAGVAA